MLRQSAGSGAGATHPKLPQPIGCLICVGVSDPVDIYAIRMRNRVVVGYPWFIPESVTDDVFPVILILSLSSGNVLDNDMLDCYTTCPSRRGLSFQINHKKG